MNNDVNQNNNLFPDSKTLEQPVSHEILFETDNTKVNVSSNKKGLTNKTLILVIILIIVLSVAASGGTVYFLSQNYQNKNSANNGDGFNTLPTPNENEEQDDNEEDNKEENNQNEGEKDDNKEEEVTPVTLTNEELEAYLEYIPFGIYDHSTLPYYNKISTIVSVDKTVLVNKALVDTHEFKICENPDNCLPEEVTSKFFNAYVNCYMDNHCDPKGYDFYPLDKVNANLNKMYNTNFIFLGIKEYDTWPCGGAEIMYYNSGFLSREASGFYDYVIHAIDRYEATNNELIIYDYAINGRYGGQQPIDFQNGKIISIEEETETMEQYNELVSKYVLEHKSEYTEFKHIYKKNNTGYYWYSTEVVS